VQSNVLQRLSSPLQRLSPGSPSRAHRGQGASPQGGAKAHRHRGHWGIPHNPRQNKRHPNCKCWRLACVADLVRASSLAAAKASPQNACWSRALPVAGFKAAFPCTTHTPYASSLSFTCSTYKARRACKSEAKILQREHPNCTVFSTFFSLYAVVGGAAISLRRRPARRHLVCSTRRGLERAKNGLLSADRSC
jgi:hypothetical protein